MNYLEFEQAATSGLDGYDPELYLEVLSKHFDIYNSHDRKGWLEVYARDIEPHVACREELEWRIQCAKDADMWEAAAGSMYKNRRNTARQRAKDLRDGKVPPRKDSPQVHEWRTAAEINELLLASQVLRLAEQRFDYGEILTKLRVNSFNRRGMNFRTLLLVAKAAGYTLELKQIK